MSVEEAVITKHRHNDIKRFNTVEGPVPIKQQHQNSPPILEDTVPGARYIDALHCGV